ncbi:MAG: hypothetical protein ACP5QK_02180 [Myxococcota bacterium]
MNRQKLNNLRETMLNCDKNCKGIEKSLDNDIIPRGMIFESNDNDNDKFVFIVGMNPAKETECEKEYVRNNKADLLNKLGFEGKPENFFGNNCKTKSYYYVKIKPIVQKIEKAIVGCDVDNFYWTELIKC